MLLAASYLFYMSWQAVFILLILPLTVFNWLWGKYIQRCPEKAKLLLGIGIGANLLTLAVFKYTGFILSTLNSVSTAFFHTNLDLTANILLPLGISFFVFEFIHYLFEIYRGKEPIPSFVLFALFAAFFPTQIAGPIKRYPDFAKQMQTEQKFSLQYFDEGIPLIIVGLAKKVLLADQLSVLVSAVLVSPGSYTSLELWLFAYAFAFQIYFDFSGYTDIARGSAMLFGYHIPLNFNMPYIAKNIADFWHRWHISLSTWLRDYLFIPLGGSKEGPWKTNRNLFVTMTLGGLWHGAAWNFVIWGIFHGLCLIVHREFSIWRQESKVLSRFFESKVWSALSLFLTFQTVCIGWVFFRVQNISDALLIVKRMVLLSPLMPPQWTVNKCYVLLNPNLPLIVPVVLLMVLILVLTNLPLSYLNQIGLFKRAPAPLKAVFCAFLIFAMVVTLPDSSKPFIYFQF